MVYSICAWSRASSFGGFRASGDHTSYGDHNMFTLALCEQLFWSTQDVGAAHQDKLNPIPLPTLALLFTMVYFLSLFFSSTCLLISICGICFHLDCYENGQCNDSIVFSEADYYNHYRVHLSWAKHWLAVDLDEMCEI